MTAPLWTSAEAAAATGGWLEGEWTTGGVAIDSRNLAAGDLFVALKDARDGHDFVADALAAGAGAAMVERRPEGLADGAPLLYVSDTLEALGKLGAAGRARAEMKVIGVTGSVGKTGVKEMLRAMLSPSGLTHAAEKSFNNHWGVPLTLARTPRDARFAAIEMGMNHPGEIGPLSRLARPDVAIITTIAAVHMAAFASLDDIAAAKAEIFEGLAPGGVAVINRDVDQFPLLEARARAAGAKVVTFGQSDAADARMEAARVTSAATVVRGALHGRSLMFKIAAPGAHLAVNAVAALAAVDAAGGDLARATLALSSWTPPAGRGSRSRIRLGEDGLDGEVDLIDESYNANPASMRAALAVLAAAEPGPRGRRIAFLGDMLELGPEETAMHAGLAEAAAAAGIDTVHTAGPLMRGLHDALPRDIRGEWREDSVALAEIVRRAVGPGDAVMIKGSLGSAMAKVVQAVRVLGETDDKRGAA